MNKIVVIIIIATVVVIVAAIAAVMILPQLIYARQFANEKEAINSLKQIMNAEAQWYQLDPDQNGINDYWTYDVSCLYRMYQEDGLKKVAFIRMDLARADSRPADTNNIYLFGDFPLIDIWISSEMGVEPAIGHKSGYWFTVLDYPGLDTSIFYNQNKVGTNKLPACNSTQFGFMAVPDVYGIAGFSSFIVNQEGKIWGIRNPCIEDGLGFGGNIMKPPTPGSKPTGKKWTTDAVSGKSLCWPMDANNPTPAGFKGLGGEPWEPVN